MIPSKELFECGPSASERLGRARSKRFEQGRIGLVRAEGVLGIAVAP
jgi:hypothetical protein